MLETPVLFLVFNRPDSTKKVFEQIRMAQPKQLFIAADGPRIGSSEDLSKCAETKSVILDSIDWNCEIKTLFRKENLGCGKAVSQAISWFFENVEEGIILEDDCVPNQSFFTFCSELLNKYRDNPSIMHITGNNFNTDAISCKESYHFSKYPFIWGWASWKRAWNQYDYDLNNIAYYHKVINKRFKNPFEKDFWKSRITLIKNNTVNTWDYQWFLSIWASRGISITPNYNLVTNIGFGIDSTHNKSTAAYSNLESNQISTIIHPISIETSKENDKIFVKNLLGITKSTYSEYLAQKLKNLIHKISSLKY